MNSDADNPWKHARPNFKNTSSSEHKPPAEDGSHNDLGRTSKNSRGTSGSAGRLNEDGQRRQAIDPRRAVRDPRQTNSQSAAAGLPKSASAGLSRSDHASSKQLASSQPQHRPEASDLPAEAQVARITSGRLLAYKTLQTYACTDTFLQDIFSDLDDQHQLISAERGAAVDIASGVIRRQRTIDSLLRTQISRPRHKVENDLWRVLQIGVYQLVFGRTPDHAAVDSTVELCRQLDRERWTKFVNGVLRGVGRLLTAEVIDRATADAVPLQSGQWRRLSKAILPDRETQFSAWMAEAFSLPDILADRWATRMTAADAIAAGFHSLESPRTTLRINRLQTTREIVADQLTQHGCQVIPSAVVSEASPGVAKDIPSGPRPTGLSMFSHITTENSLTITGGSRIERLPGFADGLWSVQDDSAMQAASLLQPQPGELILDMCAAPGGKTCHLAELSDDQAIITACDVSEDRLQRIRDNADRLQLKSVTTLLVARDGHNFPAGPFDAILVDVPCSNTGVLGRRPEARWRFSEQELVDLVPLQSRLLIQACERLRPGGRIVYSTCSVEAEENRQVVDAVLRAFPTLAVVCDQQFLPGQPSDGAYQALIVNTAQP